MAVVEIPVVVAAPVVVEIPVAAAEAEVAKSCMFNIIIGTFPTVLKDAPTTRDIARTITMCIS